MSVPQRPVFRRRRQRPVERRRGVLQPAHQLVGAAEHPVGVSGVRRAGLASLGRGALRLALQEQGVRHQMAGLALRHPERVRPLQLRLRGAAVAEQQVGARLSHSQRLVVRPRLDRVQEFDPGGARVPLRQGLQPAVIGLVGRFRARIGAGRGTQQQQRDQGGAGVHG
jgi:hypothetical protein